MSRYLLLFLLLSFRQISLAQVISPKPSEDVRPSPNAFDLVVPNQPTAEEAYLDAQKNTLLLRNNDDVLPLKRLDTLQIVNFNLGMSSDNAFRQTLAQYARIHHLQIPFDIMAGHETTLWKEIKDANLFIIGIGSGRITASQRDFLNQAVKRIKSVIFFNGTLEEYGNMPTENDFSALLMNSWDDELNQSVAAQIIFGGAYPGNELLRAVKNNNTLPKVEKENWVHRLGYAAPQVVGIDSAQLHEGIDSVVNDGLSNKAFPGAQVLVAKAGKVIFQKSYGYHTYDQKRAVENTDLYDYASVTKVTGALPAIMKLHGEGRFDLNATLGNYFPLLKGSNKENLDFKNILAHNARLKPYIVYWQNTLRKNGKYKWRTFKDKKSRRFPIRITDNLYLHHKYKKRIYKAIKESPLEEKTEYKYSGLSFILYPEILRKLTAIDYETYLQNNFYKPLGASTITFNPYLHFPLDRIVPTERDTFFRMAQVHGGVHDEAASMMAGVSANAGLFSNANDLAKLFQMYLNGGTYGGERYIAEESLKTFTKCQFCDGGNHRGLGFDKPSLEIDENEVSISSPGFSIEFWALWLYGDFRLGRSKRGFVIYLFFK